MPHLHTHTPRARHVVERKTNTRPHRREKLVKYQTVDFGFWFRFGFAWGDGQGGHEWDDFKTIFILVFLLICFSLMEGEEWRAKWSEQKVSESWFLPLLYCYLILCQVCNERFLVFLFVFVRGLKNWMCLSRRQQHERVPLILFCPNCTFLIY